MLTLADAPARTRDDRPAYRPYRVEVAALTPLSGHFVRVTLVGDALDEFGTDLHDQRIKLVFPYPDGSFGDFGIDDPAAHRAGDWYPRLRALPVPHAFRTYTVRAVRPELREIDIDFVVHGVTGPAAAWLDSAGVGSPLVVVGPTALSLNSAGGIDWHPGPATSVLLAGDETAAPAICSILEQLPEHVTAHAFLEVPDAADAIDVSRNGDRITWLARGEGQHGSKLEPAVRSWVAENRGTVRPILRQTEELADVDVDVELIWDAPEQAHLGFYAWIAGESGMIKQIRRFLVSETGVDRHQVAFMGYWRLGRAEAQV